MDFPEPRGPIISTEFDSPVSTVLRSNPRIFSHSSSCPRKVMKSRCKRSFRNFRVVSISSPATGILENHSVNNNIQNQIKTIPRTFNCDIESGANITSMLPYSRFPIGIQISSSWRCKPTRKILEKVQYKR